jgi:hypothetical protein
MSRIYSKEWLNETIKNAKIVNPGLTSIEIPMHKDPYYRNIYYPDYTEIRNTISFEDVGYVDKFAVSTVNCVTYALYFVLQDNDYEKSMLLYSRYLDCINESIKTINTLMPNWIVRIYFDKWLRDVMKRKTATSQIRELADKIIKFPNVESYFMIVDGSNHLNRCFRILPLMDDTIGICVMKDADSIFTAVDAHNYNLFVKSFNHVFLYTNLHSYKLPFASDWHEYSYKFNIHEIYNNKDKDFSGSGVTKRHPDNKYPYNIKESILCGLFASKIHLTPEIVKKVFDRIREKIPSNNLCIYDEVSLNMLYSPLFAEVNSTTMKVFYDKPKLEVEIKKTTNNNSIIDNAKELNHYLCSNFDYLFNDINEYVSDIIGNGCDTSTLLNLRSNWVKGIY